MKNMGVNGKMKKYSLVNFGMYYEFTKNYFSTDFESYVRFYVRPFSMHVQNGYFSGGRRNYVISKQLNLALSYLVQCLEM